jgi:hypothetical protein
MWVMPDFGYWSWPLDLVGEYEQVRTEMQDSEVEWEKKIPKVLWRGAVKTNKEVRGALMKVTRGKPWADVDEVTWKSMTQVNDKSKVLPIAEHCKYQFLIHTEGKMIIPHGVKRLKLNILMKLYCRTKLLWPGKIPAQLRVNCNNS